MYTYTIFMKNEFVIVTSLFDPSVLHHTWLCFFHPMSCSISPDELLDYPRGLSDQGIGGRWSETVALDDAINWPKAKLKTCHALIEKYEVTEQTSGSFIYFLYYH